MGQTAEQLTIEWNNKVENLIKNIHKDLDIWNAGGNDFFKVRLEISSLLHKQLSGQLNIENSQKIAKELQRLIRDIESSISEYQNTSDTKKMNAKVASQSTNEHRKTLQLWQKLISEMAEIGVTYLNLQESKENETVLAIKDLDLIPLNQTILADSENEANIANYNQNFASQTFNFDKNLQTFLTKTQPEIQPLVANKHSEQQLTAQLKHENETNDQELINILLEIQIQQIQDSIVKSTKLLKSLETIVDEMKVTTKNFLNSQEFQSIQVIVEIVKNILTELQNEHNNYLNQKAQFQILKDDIDSLMLLQKTTENQQNAEELNRFQLKELLKDVQIEHLNSLGTSRACETLCFTADDFIKNPKLSNFKLWYQKNINNNYDQNQSNTQTKLPKITNSQNSIENTISTKLEKVENNEITLLFTTAKKIIKKIGANLKLLLPSFLDAKKSKKHCLTKNEFNEFDSQAFKLKPINKNQNHCKTEISTNSEKYHETSF